jgi:hypothetical protein
MPIKECFVNSLLVRQLVQLGMFVESAPGVAIGQLKDIYKQSSADEAQIIHSAITELIDQFSKMGFAQENFRFTQKINLLVELANLTVPSLIEQVQISNSTDEIKTLVNNLEKLHPVWVEMAHTLHSHQNYIRNDEACNILIDNMPLQTSKSKKREFLRRLGDNPATAHFVAMLSDKYGLERPFFPYDWAKNIYHLMGFHLSNPSEDIRNARIHFWNTLFQLSETKLPSPHPVGINNRSSY